MFTVSAFADEISPDPQVQVDVLRTCSVKHIEFRSILGTNVLSLTDLQIGEFKSLLDSAGFRLSAIGSPIGKIRVDEPFEPHLAKFQRAIELCKLFDTPNIRVFSYYPPEGFIGDWTPHRDEVFRRTEACLQLAEAAGVRLFHENEHRIYGDSPERVGELLRHFDGPSFRAAYDAANFVFCGYDPLVGWEQCKEFMAHFHIKDWVAGAPHGCLAGTGGGQWPTVLADAARRDYAGFATLEPHLLGGGPTGGHTGPELFPQAVAAFRELLAAAGGREAE